MQMTPEQRAAKVVVDIREHALFNHVTDELWMRYITAAIEQATEGYLPIPDANEFDDVVRLLGIEDSHLTPVEAVQELMEQAKAWKDACRKAGICMSCALSAPEPFGCTDCLNTGWTSGAPAGFIPDLPREPGTCKCGAAPINSNGRCATCEDEQLAGVAEQSGAGAPETSVRCGAPAAQWRAFYNASYPKLWGIETSDPAAHEAGLEIVVAPCMPGHAAKDIVAAWNARAYPSLSQQER
jgi:hypothetical protein